MYIFLAYRRKMETRTLMATIMIALAVIVFVMFNFMVGVALRFFVKGHWTKRRYGKWFPPNEPLQPLLGHYALIAPNGLAGAADALYQQRRGTRGIYVIVYLGRPIVILTRLTSNTALDTLTDPGRDILMGRAILGPVGMDPHENRRLSLEFDKLLLSREHHEMMGSVFREAGRAAFDGLQSGHDLFTVVVQWSMAALCQWLYRHRQETILFAWAVTAILYAWHDPLSQVFQTPWLAAIPIRARRGRALRALRRLLEAEGEPIAGSLEHFVLEHSKTIKTDRDLLRQQPRCQWIKRALCNLLVSHWFPIATTVFWALAQLANRNNQTWLQRLRKTQDHDQNQTLRLLEVILETLRMYPPSLIQMRTASSTLNGYRFGDDFHVPAQTELVVPIYSMNRDPAHFPDPNKFLNGRELRCNPHYCPFGLNREAPSPVFYYACQSMLFGFLRAIPPEKTLALVSDEATLLFPEPKHRFPVPKEGLKVVVV
jgi:hypothetical protein